MISSLPTNENHLAEDIVLSVGVATNNNDNDVAFITNNGGSPQSSNSAVSLFSIGRLRTANSADPADTPHSLMTIETNKTTDHSINSNANNNANIFITNNNDVNVSSVLRQHLHTVHADGVDPLTSHQQLVTTNGPALPQSTRPLQSRSHNSLHQQQHLLQLRKLVTAGQGDCRINSVQSPLSTVTTGCRFYSDNGKVTNARIASVDLPRVVQSTANCGFNGSSVNVLTGVHVLRRRLRSHHPGQGYAHNSDAVDHRNDWHSDTVYAGTPIEIIKTVAQATRSHHSDDECCRRSLQQLQTHSNSSDNDEDVEKNGNIAKNKMTGESDSMTSGSTSGQDPPPITHQISSNTDNLCSVSTRSPIFRALNFSSLTNTSPHVNPIYFCHPATFAAFQQPQLPSGVLSFQNPLPDSDELQSIFDALRRPLEMVYDASLDVFSVDLTSCMEIQPPFTNTRKYVQLLNLLTERFRLIVRFPWYDYARFCILTQSVQQIFIRTSFPDYSPFQIAHDVFVLLRCHMRDTEYEDMQLYFLFVIIDFARNFQQIFLPMYTGIAVNLPGRDTGFLLKIVQTVMNETSMGRNAYEFEVLQMQIDRRIRIERHERRD